MALFTKIRFARFFVLLLFMQQGLPAFAYAATAVSQISSEHVTVVTAHECGTMADQLSASAADELMTPDGSMQHDDCNDSGCDSCVGCIAGVAGFRHTVPFVLAGEPTFAQVNVAPAVPAPDLLYRPPIAS